MKNYSIFVLLNTTNKTVLFEETVNKKVEFPTLNEVGEDIPYMQCKTLLFRAGVINASDIVINNNVLSITGRREDLKETVNFNVHLVTFNNHGIARAITGYLWLPLEGAPFRANAYVSNVDFIMSYINDLGLIEQALKSNCNYPSQVNEDVKIAVFKLGSFCSKEFSEGGCVGCLFSNAGCNPGIINTMVNAVKVELKETEDIPSSKLGILGE